MLRTSALISALLLCACSSDSDDGGGKGGGGGSSLTAFSAYCTGSLLKEMPLMESGGPGSWSSSGASAPAGTTILLGATFDKWEGFAIQDGTVLQVDADFSTGMVKDTDFSSSCATDEKVQGLDQHMVLLTDTTVYVNAEMSGEPCKLAAGTELTGYSFAAGQGSASISATEIQEKCAIDQGYTSDMIYAKLVTK